MTVSRLLTELDDYELFYWMALDQIEPMSDDWLQTGLICSTMANCHAAKGKSFKPSDFMPIDKTEKKAQTPDEMKAVLDCFVRRADQKEIKGERLR